jgi:hypothetical protein
MRCRGVMGQVAEWPVKAFKTTCDKYCSEYVEMLPLHLLLGT